MKVEKLLIEQLRHAHDRWEYLETARMRLLELHLGFFGITGVGLIVAKENKTLLDSAPEIVKIAIPILFSVVGLCFFTMFLYKEHFFRIAKSWLRRIEEELQLYSKKEKKTKKRVFTGAYYPYYYKASTEIDFVTLILGFSILLTTIAIVYLTSYIFTPTLRYLTAGFNFFFMILVWIIISKHNEKVCKENSNKYP